MHSVRLAVDVHGGDFGVPTMVRGVLDAFHLRKEPFTAHLCGDRTLISQTLDSEPHLLARWGDNVIIEHSLQAPRIHDMPSRVWKHDNHSSIVRCVALQKEGVVDASLSAGDTRILMGASIFILGRQTGIVRPALAAFLPTIARRPSLLIDVGANLNCRAEHLVAFGKIGYEYVKRFFSLDNPSVALLNIGKEPSKVTRIIGEAAERLSTECRGYIGFIEGNKVLSGEADVIVCDGFTGNVLLKACESFYGLAMSVLGGKRELGTLMKERVAILNPENYGAVPLLGIRGVVFKAHGSSTDRAIAHALLTAVQAVEQETFCHQYS